MEVTHLQYVAVDHSSDSAGTEPGQQPVEQASFTIDLYNVLC